MIKYRSVFSYFLLGLSLLLVTLASAKETNICSRQVYAHPTGQGYTWTLASRLGRLLELAENEYGERNKNWTILGTEFTDEKQPSNWYPGGYKKKKIIILLTADAANDETEAIYQLAHEVIHTLSPNDKHDSNYFEEGIATFFALHATNKMGFSITTDYISSKKYRKAYKLINIVYKAYPDAGKRIAKARKTGLLFSTFHEDQLSVLFPKIPRNIVEQLAEKF